MGAELTGLGIVADHFDPTDVDVTDSAVRGVDDEVATRHPFVDVAGIESERRRAVRRDGRADGDPRADQGVQQLELWGRCVRRGVSEAGLSFWG